jgi:23S rRNA (guanosine2251-2'-O)-methyltransferase
MAGNAGRPGAGRRRDPSKGIGSGGRGRKALKGRGPTPKAEDRVGHPARARAEAAKRAGRRSSRGGRARSSETIVGRNPVLEALRTEIPAEGLKVFSRIEADDRVREILALAVSAGLDVREVARPDLDALAGGAAHQGIALAVRPFAYADLIDLVDGRAHPLVVALDGIQDPRNLGAILRSAAAFGATGVLIPERRAASVTAAAWKASAGAASRVKVARVGNLVRSVVDLKGRGCFVVGLDAAAEVSLRDCPLLEEPLVVAVGSEGKGLSRLMAAECDQLVSIPISEATESLNASVAASVALYEARRAREGRGR